MAQNPRPDPLTDRVVAAIGDRYEIEGELGRGGMAVVYRARDVRLRRAVALKVLPPDLAFRDGVRARFLREAETAAQLSHPNIVPIYAADETSGVAWLAMALVEGETLGARMAREPRLTVPETRRILAEVADALGYANARGVVHRDIKPDNILLDRESGRAMVTDFGIARAAEADQRLTVTGIAVGTPTYMSPEQALGESEIDGRSDLYSLGVVAYQMLGGTPPFSATSAAALLMKHVGERPRPLGEVRPDVPRELADAIDRVLAKKPDQRYLNGAAFRAAVLGEVPNGSSSGRASTAAAAQPLPLPPMPPMATPQRPPSAADPAYAPTAPVDWQEEHTDWRAELRERRREWRGRDKEQRAARREFEREYKEAARGGTWRGGLPVPAPPSPAPLPGRVDQGWGGARGDPNAAPDPRSLEERAERFRRKAVSSMLIVAFLGFLNIVTTAGSGVPFPWVIFPAFAILGGLRRRWRREFARDGISYWGLILNGPERAVVQATGRDARGLTRLEGLVRRFRSRTKVAVGAAVLSIISFIIGDALSADPMIVPFVGFMVISGLATLSALRTGWRLRRARVPLGAALSSRWQDAVRSADPRSRDVVLADDANHLVGESVLAGPYGRVVRGAVEDRLVVRETLAKLAPADRALLPEIPPTIDSLVGRIAELAQSLHRLDADVSPEQLDQLNARLRSAEAEPQTAPDRERKLQLLQRQRASLAELLEKRASLAAQLESAQLVLQNIKLDLIKLRSKGVGAALGEVSTATQEARALSRDIQYALDAAAEVRGL
jgi:hypothetical protein